MTATDDEDRDERIDPRTEDRSSDEQSFEEASEDPSVDAFGDESFDSLGDRSVDALRDRSVDAPRDLSVDPSMDHSVGTPGDDRRGLPNHNRMDEPPNVLIVDDEPFLLGMYAAKLEDDYRVETASGGEAALEYLFEDDAFDPDVVLLDRRMPDLSGDEVLDRIHERDLDCQVAMITGVEPEFDVAEMPFDAYVIKPVRERELRRVVESLLDRSQFQDRSQELFSVTARLAALERNLPESALERDSEYLALKERKAELEAETETTLEELLDSRTREVLYRDILEEYKR